ncbi:MAG: PLD nuclease N-terminal domain-containing protein [Cytophagales bacterium]|nr:PLD nuclease N-terminal domain-containing protein [Cytophagales bacterium]
MEFAIFGVIVVSIAIYAMIDIANRSIRTKTKIIWFPVVVLIPLIGPLCYFFLRRSLN